MFLLENLYDCDIYLVDHVTVTMQDHKNRSMRSDNQELIRKRIKATYIVEDRLKLTSQEYKILWAYTYYFCAVHAFLDNNQKQGLKLISDALKLHLNASFLKMLVKLLIGKSVVDTFLGSIRSISKKNKTLSHTPHLML